jgi:uncharacterized protein (TIGR02453 family)
VTGAPRFSPEALTFLRALKRNNDREWFRARKERYETLVRTPMMAVIEHLAADFRTFAPDLAASPRESMFRPYRDTRFSDNKAPLKTQIGAVFPRRGAARHHGAGLYFEIGPDGVWIGGGMYAPDTSVLQIEREHIAANSRRLRSIIESPAFRRLVGKLEGAQLQRVPRGFPRDHEAADLLRFRQFLAGVDRPAAFASSPRFYQGVVTVFRVVAPLVAFLNEPLRDAGRPSPTGARLH